MAKKRKTRTIARSVARRPRAPSVPDLQPLLTRVQDGIRLIMERIDAIEARMGRLEGRMEPLGDLSTLPSRGDVDAIKRDFRTVRTYIEDAKERINQLTGMRDHPHAEFTSRAEFTGWKAAIEERLVALEREHEAPISPERPAADM